MNIKINIKESILSVKNLKVVCKYIDNYLCFKYTWNNDNNFL